MRAAVRLLPLPPEAFRSLRVEENDVIIKARHGQDASLTHEMDKVFTEDCSQGDVYDWVAPAVEDVAKKGVNATVMAYGQTGTGKTFTMEGVNHDEALKGVIPRTFGHIFEAIETTSWPSSRSGSAALSDAMQAIALCRDAGEGVGA